MTKKRTGEPWMPAAEYGRSLPPFTVNLAVRDVARSVAFYSGVFGAKVHYTDADFAALELAGTQFMLHADHTYDQHPLASRLAASAPRGTGTELRVSGVNPDELEARARANGATIVQAAADRAHGGRDVILTDPDGYIWAVGVPLPK